MTTAQQIQWPSAHELDTDSDASGNRTHLYLVPPEENDGAIAITTYRAIGGNSWPMMAHHGRWLALGTLPHSLVGKTALPILQSYADQLIALSDKYLGTEWNGSNYIGKWDLEPYIDPIEMEWSDAKTYWDADDYLSACGKDWDSVCEAFDIDSASSPAELVAAIEANAEAHGAYVMDVDDYVERLHDSRKEKTTND